MEKAEEERREWQAEMDRQLYEERSLRQKAEAALIASLHRLSVLEHTLLRHEENMDSKSALSEEDLLASIENSLLEIASLFG
mmetsp:Transcript_11800/g.29798  ORF Transcript_11800/g.29798 Transcript_11800/m.29798 type:complete len:82 (-) Transcript_11800:92-337(-)